LAQHTNFQGTYFNPKFDQLYQAHTSQNLTMVTEVLPKTALIKVEVGYLGGSISTFGADFVTNITSQKSVASLALGVSNFFSLHPETSARVQLPFQNATLLINDPPSPSTFTDNPYIQASRVGQILDTVFGFVFKLASFVPVIGDFSGSAFEVIKAGLDLAQAVSNVGVQVPSTSLPFTDQNSTGGANTFPLKSWVTNESFVTYTVTESMNYVNGGSLAPPNPPPIPRDFTNWHVSSVSLGTSQGPWVNGVVSLGAGYQCRLQMRQTTTLGPALLPVTHFYEDAPIAPTLGQPGLIPNTDVKPGVSSKLPLDGGGFSIQGAWTSQGYNVNDVVTIGGVAYACILATPGPAAPQPGPPNATFWEQITGLVNRGAWDPATIYNIGDYVQFQSLNYTCVFIYNPTAPQPTPPNVTYWTPLTPSSNLVTSTYKYVQYLTELSVNNPNINDINGLPVPAGWNAVFLNGVLYGVFDGLVWHQSDNLINP
jgi:hypothetical protein